MNYSLPVDLRKHSWASPDGRMTGRFNPQGKIGFAYPQAIRKNPHYWASNDDMWSARVFVGFNVGNESKWTMEDLVGFVKPIRERQVGKPDMSIVYQKGIYTSERDGKSVVENSAQIVILNLPDFKTEHKEFEAQMIEMADILIDQMEQETIFINMQLNGISRKTHCVASQEYIDEHEKKK